MPAIDYIHKSTNLNVYMLSAVIVITDDNVFTFIYDCSNTTFLWWDDTPKLTVSLSSEHQRSVNYFQKNVAALLKSLQKVTRLNRTLISISMMSTRHICICFVHALKICVLLWHYARCPNHWFLLELLSFTYISVSPVRLENKSESLYENQSFSNYFLRLALSEHFKTSDVPFECWSSWSSAVMHLPVLYL